MNKLITARFILWRYHKLPDLKRIESVYNALTPDWEVKELEAAYEDRVVYYLKQLRDL